MHLLNLACHVSFIEIYKNCLDQNHVDEISSGTQYHILPTRSVSFFLGFSIELTNKKCLPT